MTNEDFQRLVLEQLTNMDRRFKRMDERFDDIDGRLKNVEQNMATKEDLASVRTELKGDIDSVRTDLKDDIGSVRTELKGDIGSLKTELKGDIDSVRTDLKGDIAALDAKVDKLALATQQDVLTMLKHIDKKTDVLPRIEEKIYVLNNRMLEDETDISLLKKALLTKNITDNVRKFPTCPEEKKK